MAKLRVGVVMFQKSDPTEGGAYSYQELLLKGINEYNFNPDIEIVNIIFYNAKKEPFNLNKHAVYIKRGLGVSLRDTVKHSTNKYFNLKLSRHNSVINFFSSYVLKKRDKRAEEILRKNKIDVLFYLKPEWEVLNYPFIATHWDNCHKSIPPFPEVALDGMYEKRERYHLYTLHKALLILCESEAGKTELEKLNNYNSSKIKVVPIFAGSIIQIQSTIAQQQQTLTKYGLHKEEFLLYPAQFWAHKNHYNLVQAFNKFITESQNEELKIVLCGSDKGNLDYIKSVVDSISLNHRILIPGFISVEELNHLYKNALALIMPTFLGPTNMPVIEAAHLNCPVLCSNLPGHKEILGNNALYFEPTDTNSIKDSIEQILDEKLRQELIEKAGEHIQQSPFNLQTALKALDSYFTQIIPIRKSWGY